MRIARLCLDQLIYWGVSFSSDPDRHAVSRSGYPGSKMKTP